ncbi:MAG: undecaprenyldiphospho-muramoylpentapeptide beta-N-acetylglucosaminyltransferase [Candidatus Bipolaricaulota bacterium]|nr:undecaprenyldiphospho-muramoylpentapeptide beta-N-acetylglucosaminyltransferase [Candidatus Bipolaricaulota bacterium]
MRLVVAAGGTGGHVYPALAILDELRARGELVEAAWIGTPHGIEARVVGSRAGIQFVALPSRGLDRRRPWTWPGTLVGAASRFVRSLALLRRFRPDAVLGTGGHAALAPLLAARLLGIPCAVHEQNARMGLANRILARLGCLVLLSFPQTQGVPRAARTLVTGNPVRREIALLSPELGDELLVVGGSRGARALVDAVLRAAPELARTPGLQLRLVVGSAAPVEGVAQALARAGVRAEVVPYADPFSDALARARLVVARAGATTAAELAAAGRPAVLIPWAGAADGHQEENARAWAQAGGALVLPETAAHERLGSTVTRLWTDERTLRAMAAAARAAARPDAARRAAEALRALAKERRS